VRGKEAIGETRRIHCRTEEREMEGATQSEVVFKRAPKLDPTLAAFVAAWSANIRSNLCFSALLFCASMHVCLAAWSLRFIL